MAKAAKSEARLRAGVEFGAGRLIAARATANGDALAAASVRTLPPGALVPSLTMANIHDHAAVVNAVRDAMAAVGERAGDAVAVLPDSVCRVSLLDFDEFPDREEEATGVVRFRLKKAMPFDTERAALSYDVQRTASGVKVVAAVAMQSVVDEYESVLRAAGFAPGVVLPSTAAALGVLDPSVPTMLLKVDAGTTSLAIAHETSLLLYRTIEAGVAGGISPDQLADDVYASLIFFEDTYALKIGRMLLGGVPAADLAPALENATGVRVEELVTASLFTGTAPAERNAMGGIAGALIGA